MGYVKNRIDIYKTLYTPPGGGFRVIMNYKIPYSSYLPNNNIDQGNGSLPRYSDIRLDIFWSPNISASCDTWDREIYKK